jgi:hypothetical protein
VVTTPQGPETPSTTKEEIAERMAVLTDEAAKATRNLLTGSGSGRVRRNLLFALTAVLIVAGSLLAVLPLMLLALTDAVVLDG